MSVLYIVVPLALIVVAAAVVAFAWAARHGQFDDLDTPAVRALFDEETTASRGTKPAEPSGHAASAATLNAARRGPAAIRPAPDAGPRPGA